MSNLSWQLANGFGILRDPTNDIWHAGHVNDILAVGYSAIVASDTGGVWIINPDFDAIPVTSNYAAQCVSNDWDQVDMSSLAFAPNDQSHVFAGCWSSATLYLLTLQTNLGDIQLSKWTQIPVPFWAAGITKIVTIANPWMIVLACATGVFWSPIPSVVDQVSGYQWTKASSLPVGGGYSGLAVGPSSTIVAAAWGSNVQDGLYGIFTGAWDQQLTNLSFTRASISNVDPTLMLRTSIASCATNRNIMYAVSGGANDGIYQVLASSDGGNNWAPKTIPDKAGNQQGYNNCIDVHPSDASMVAIGWRGGPFVSRDGAGTWSTPGAGDDGLHSDLHVVYFPNLQDDSDALFVGSDGGVALVSGAGKVTSAYNKHLANLQIYAGDDSASAQYAGLYAAATQDNGNVYCVVDSNAPPMNQPWFTLDDGDGGECQFIDIGQLIRYNNTLVINGVEVGNRVRSAPWNPVTQQFDGGVGQVIFVDGTHDGLALPILEPVKSPQYTRHGQLMYALGGSQFQIYGLFSDPDGANMRWTPLVTLTEDVSALASLDGNTIIAGTSNGNIYSCDAATGTPNLMPTSALPAASITRIVEKSSSLMFGLHKAGFVLIYDGSFWRPVTGLVQQNYSTLEIDTTEKAAVLYVATDNVVFSSQDNGQTWSNQSNGLPARVHCSDLRFVVQPDGSKFLYLGTYGRSLWRARVSGPSGGHRVSP